MRSRIVSYSGEIKAKVKLYLDRLIIRDEINYRYSNPGGIMYRFVFLSIMIVLFAVGTSPAVAQSQSGKDSPPTIDLKGEQIHPKTPRWWSNGLYILGGLSTPFHGSSETDANPGAGYEFAWAHVVHENMSLRVTFGRSGIAAENFFGTIPVQSVSAPLPPHVHVTNQRTKLDAYRYFLSLQLNSSNMDLHFTKSMFYLYGGLGFVKHITSLTSHYYNDSTEVSSTNIYDDKIYTFANTFGGGVNLMITKNIGCDFAMAVDVVHDGQSNDYYTVQSSEATNTSSYQTRAINYGGTFDLRLGLVVIF